MNRTEITSKVLKILRDNNIKKSVSVPDTFFYLVDEKGNKNKFTVSLPDKDVMYTLKDISNILDGFFAAIEDCIKHGEEVSIYGMGSIKLSKREAYMQQVPGRDEWFDVPEHYIPYCKVGEILKQAARIYEASLRESHIDIPEPIYDACESEDE